MDNLIKYNESVKNECNKLLSDYKLMDILKEYGDVTLTGSYELDLMVWRDLDLYIDVDKVNLENIYNLVNTINNTFKPVWGEYKDTRNDNSGCPKGFFVGFETYLISDELWNIDIWFASKDYIKKSKEYIKNIKEIIDDNNKQIILKIKSDLCKNPSYGSEFFSIVIYDGVLKNGIETKEEFIMWISNR